MVEAEMGLPLAGNIVAFREDLVAFSQGIVREKGKDWTSLLLSIFNCCMSQGLKILYIHGFQEHLLVLFSWIQELVQVSTRSAEGFAQTMTLISVE